MRTVNIIIPAEQREGTKSSVGRWLKNVGDSVQRDEPIVEIYTDKVTLEVAAPATGTLKAILKQEQEEIELSEPLGKIETAEQGADSEVTAKPQMTAAVPTPREEASLFSPAVRVLAKKHGVDPAAISGTGKNGRVTAEDIEREAAKRAQGGAEAIIKRPHSPMRKSIAAHMTRSMAEVPHVTSVFEIDFSAVLADKAKRAQEFSAQGVKLTVTTYLVRAAALALRAVPEVNSRWHADYLELLNEIHIGVATAVESAQDGGAGLLVPVIKNAAKLTLVETARAIQDLTSRARCGKCTSDELSGATFSISNHGVGGSLFAAPIIIPQPQAAILGAGKIEKRAAVVKGAKKEDTIVVREAAYVTLTIDHRALDGFTANTFLRKFADALQAPA